MLSKYQSTKPYHTKQIKQKLMEANVNAATPLADWLDCLLVGWLGNVPNNTMRLWHK